MQPAAGPWRVVRASLVAAVCVACSLSAHVAAGGAAPDGAVLAGSWSAVAAVAYALSGRRWTFGRLLLVLGAGQLVLHPLFGAGGMPAATESTAESVAMTAAHLVAAAALAALLAHGDLVLWRLADVVCALLCPSPLLVDPHLPPATPSRLPVPVAADVTAPGGLGGTPAAERAPPAVTD